MGETSLNKNAGRESTTVASVARGGIATCRPQAAESKGISPNIKKLLRASRKALPETGFDYDEQYELISLLESLTEELKKDTPKKHLIQIFWNGLSGLVTKAQAISELGAALATTYQIVT